MEEATDALKPVQMGIGIKDGQAITYHWVKAKCDTINSGLSEGKILLKADISNAFGTISRRAMRDGVLQKLPRLLYFYDWAYSSGIELFLGDRKN